VGTVVGATQQDGGFGLGTGVVSSQGTMQNAQAAQAAAPKFDRVEEVRKSAKNSFMLSGVAAVIAVVLYMMIQGSANSDEGTGVGTPAIFLGMWVAASAAIWFFLSAIYESIKAQNSKLQRLDNEGKKQHEEWDKTYLCLTCDYKFQFEF
jgi:ABC-type Fe3+ transport system permease subunit